MKHVTCVGKMRIFTLIYIRILHVGTSADLHIRILPITDGQILVIGRLPQGDRQALTSICTLADALTCVILSSHCLSSFGASLFILMTWHIYRMTNFSFPSWPSTFVPGSKTFTERTFVPVELSFAPWNFHSSVATVPWNFHPITQERKFLEHSLPRNGESSKERMFHGTEVLSVDFSLLGTQCPDT